MVDEQVIATVVGVAVSLSLPFYLYGAWIMLDAEVVTWDTLLYHLKFIAVGLTLTTGPVVGWMGRRILNQLSGSVVIHAFFGLQAYALLVFALTGIYRIFQAKYAANLYENPNQDIALDELHENMSHWRSRLRVGVFGYTLLWIAAWFTGLYRFYVLYFT